MSLAPVKEDFSFISAAIQTQLLYALCCHCYMKLICAVSMANDIRSDSCVNSYICDAILNFIVHTFNIPRTSKQQLKL